MFKAADFSSCGDSFSDDVDVYISTKRRMINSLFREINDSEDRIYMEQIISIFDDIIERQRETIGELMTDIAAADGYGPMGPSFIAVANTSGVSAPNMLPDEWYDIAAARELNPYMPPEGGFQTDEQVRKAFTNYLTYHVVRKTKSGKEKPFSIHTIYDYSSRIKVLWEIVYDEWLRNSRDGELVNEEIIISGSTFLNAYNHIPVLKRYVQQKEVEIREIATGLRKPLSAEEIQSNPLNNARNLGNTMAALAKLAEFKESVVHR